MNTDAMIDALKVALERTLPTALIVFAGIMLTLGIGMTWLLEGPELIRSMTSGLAQPFRSLALLIGLGLPLVILWYSARLLMGYTIARMSKR